MKKLKQTGGGQTKKKKKRFSLTRMGEKTEVCWMLSYTFTEAVLQSPAGNSSLILTHSRKT